MSKKITFVSTRHLAGGVAASVAGFAILSSLASLRAADLYWNGISTTWDTSSLTWNPAADNSGTTQAWVDGGNAIFSTTDVTGAGPTTLTNAGVTVDNITLLSGTQRRIQISSGTLTLADTSMTIDVQQRISGDYDLRINSVIADSSGGASSIIKTGAGILHLGGGTNTFSGGVTLNEGTLAFESGTALGTGTVTLAGGNFVRNWASAAFTTGNALNVTGSVTVAAIQAARDWTLSGAITGSGNFNVANTSVNGIGPSSMTIFVTGDVSAYTGTFSHNNLASGGNRLRFGSNVGTATLTTIDASNAKFLISGSTTGSNSFDIGDGRYGTFKMGELAGTGGRVRAGWSSGGDTTFEVGNLNTNSQFAGVIENNINGAGGKAALTKVGTGTLTLAGANLYTGATTVNAGTLQIGNGTAGALSSGTAVSVSAGATLVFNQATDVTTGNAISNAGTVLGAQGAGITNTLSGVISGAGGVTQNGAGTMNLSGANTYTGTTLVSAGTLGVSGAGSIETTSGITVNGASALFATSSSATVTPVVTVTLGKAGGSGGGVLDTVNVADNVGAGISTGTGGLTINSLTLDGAATFNWTAPSTLNVGTFTINSSAGSLTLAGSAASWASSVTPYTILSATSIAGSGAGLGAFTLGDVTANFSGLTPRQTATAALAGSTIALTIAGDNYPKWTGIESNAWNTTAMNNWKLVNGGAATAFINGDQVLFDDTASNGTVTINDGNVSVSGLTFDNTTLAYTVSGANGIAGAGAFVKNGAAALTLGTTNTFSGGATINAGTVTASATGALGTGAVAINGGTLSLNAASSVGINGLTLNSGALNIGDAMALNAGALTINGGVIDNTSGAPVTLSNAVSVTGDLTFGGTNDLNLGTNAIALTADRTFTTNGSANLTIGGVISGGFALTKAGAGTLTLGAVNTFTGGTTVNGGTLVLTKGGSAGTIRGALTINSGGVVLATAQDALGYGTPVTTLTINGGAFDNGVNANQGIDTNFILTGGTVSSSGGGSINFGSAFGITTNASSTSATWSAPILIRSGTLGINVADGAAPDDLVISGGIANLGGSFGVNKTGAGTLLLSGNSTYAGATTINGGTLKVNGTVNGPVAVTSGILAGTGTAGIATLASGGTIAPGDGGIGTLTLSSLTWMGGGVVAFDLGASDNTSDLLYINADFNLDSTSSSVFTFNFSGGMVGQTYTLVNFGTGVSDASQFSSTGVAGDFAVVLDPNGNLLTFTATAVPEPGVVALLLLGAGGVMLVARRKRCRI